MTNFIDLNNCKRLNNNAQGPFDFSPCFAEMWISNINHSETINDRLKEYLNQDLTVTKQPKNIVEQFQRKQEHRKAQTDALLYL